MFIKVTFCNQELVDTPDQEDKAISDCQTTKYLNRRTFAFEFISLMLRSYSESTSSAHDKFIYEQIGGLVKNLEIEPSNLTQELISELKDAFQGDKLDISSQTRSRHGKDLSLNSMAVPDIVAYPENMADVQWLLRWCNDRNIAIIPFGLGSSLEGHIRATQGGVCVDFSRMNKIVAYHPKDLDIVVEPGVTRDQINKICVNDQLFFAVDSGINATIGGMIGTNASGPMSIAYGPMRRQVVSLTMVLTDGTIIKTGQRAKKSCCGYDLTDLVVGAEGTLGIVVQACLRLHPIPPCIDRMIIDGFENVEMACKFVVKRLLYKSHRLLRCELLDQLALKAINQVNDTNYSTTGPSLFLEYASHGEASHREALEIMNGLVEEEGGSLKLKALGSQQWQHIYNAWHAIPATSQCKELLITDVAVPLSRLSNCIVETFEEARGMGLSLPPLIGHVGEGNFHLFLLIDPANANSRSQVQAFNSRLIRRAIEMEGTCSAEHGIGVGKSEFILDELGESTVQLMKQLKRLFDPKNILNPGKMVGQ